MKNLPCPLRAAARLRPGAPAVVDARGALSYAQLDALVDAVAAALQGRGGGPGARVALHVAPDRNAVVLLLATLRAGSAACLMNRRNPPALASAQLAQLQPRGLVTDDAALASPAADAWRAQPEELLAVTPMACAGAALELPADAPATFIFTSGSTAAPKIAVHSLRNHLASAAASNRFHGLAPTDRWLLALPLHHVGGLAILFRCLQAGACVALSETGDDLADAANRFRVTHLSLVPTQLLRLLEAPAARGLPKLACLLLGGAPAPDELVQVALARGWPVRKTYGLTEMSSQVTAVPPDAPGDKRLTGGRALEGVDLRCAPDGEIFVRGPAQFLGYWEGGRLVSPAAADGWLATGDLGSLDAEGYLRVTGRKDNLFISGGENIQPEEIEVALQALPDVVQAIVVPVPDATFGQRPVACVRTRNGLVDGAALARALGPHLPRYKIPIAFLSLPPSAGDALRVKVSRAECRAWARDQVQGQTQERGGAAAGDVGPPGGRGATEKQPGGPPSRWPPTRSKKELA